MFSAIKQNLFENLGLKQKIAKNIFWLFSGQIFGRLIRIIIVVYAARLLGPTEWGAFAYAMSLVALFTTFTDVGIGAIVTRESARNLEDSNRYFSTAFFIKLFFLIIGGLILIFGAPYLTKIKGVETIIPILAAILFFDSLRNFGFAVSRAHEKMQWEGINEIITNIFITLLGLSFLFISQTSKALSLSYAFATGVGFLIIAWQLKIYFKSVIAHFDFKLIKPILSMAWPFALASSLGAIMINTDVIMIGWLKTAEEVGFYSAAQRPIQLLYILPSLFAASLFPTFSKLAKQNIEEFKKILENALTISILMALPITLCGIILGGQIINLLFGSAYGNAAVSFQILLLTIIIIFPSIIISNAIFANDQQKKFIIFSTLGALGNIIFNFIFIIPFGIAGCALSTLITQIIANGFMWIKMREITKFSIIPNIKKIATASIITAGLILILKILSVNLIISILIGVIVYLLLLIAFKEKLIIALIQK